VTRWVRFSVPMNVLWLHSGEAVSLWMFSASLLFTHLISEVGGVARMR
jgi:hypothetical protein